MNIQSIQEVLLWCTVINYAILLLWLFFFILARDWMYRLHTRWFNISHQNFDTIHYAGMAIFKTGVALFNLVPYIAISIVI